MAQKTEIESIIEALLFYSGDSISTDRLCQICETESIMIHMAIHQLNRFYKETNSGIQIIEVEDGYQMCTASQHMVYIQRYTQKPAKKLLTQTLIEILAIIAYSQPITRAEIEEIRGVRCEHGIGKLLEYGLIEEVGRLNVIGRPILFGTTQDFLKHFGFKRLEDLPNIKEELIERFKQEVQEEMHYYFELEDDKQVDNMEEKGV